MTNKKEVVEYKVLRVFLYKHGGSSIGIEPYEHARGYISFVLGPISAGKSELGMVRYLQECDPLLEEKLNLSAKKGCLSEVRELAKSYQRLLERRRLVDLSAARINTSTDGRPLVDLGPALPCPNPNCGDGKDSLRFKPDTFLELGRGWIECEGCEMRGPHGTSMAETIDRWNRLVRITPRNS